MRAKRISQVRIYTVGYEAQCAHAGPVARPTINPTAWQTAALGIEGSSALKRRQQRPMTGPKNGAGTGRRARMAWPGWAEELRESPSWSGRSGDGSECGAPKGLRRSRSSKCSFWQLSLIRKAVRAIGGACTGKKECRCDARVKYMRARRRLGAV